MSRPDGGNGEDAGSDAGGNSDSDAGSDGGGGDAGSDGGGADAGTPLTFAGGFAPTNAPNGGFGGGAPCHAVHTPIVFLHGNGDGSEVWEQPSTIGGLPVLDTLRAAGYSTCELFGLNWLSTAEQSEPELVEHTAARAQMVRDFLNDVRAYTGVAQVDIVAHSMGVTVALHALEASGQAAGVRRFVSISGALRGLEDCLATGPANPAVITCAAQTIGDSDSFGFYPSANPRMEAGGFRDRPSALSEITFYSIGAGASDEVICPGGGCDSSLFDASANLAAQLDIGEGTPTLNVAGNDETSGIGHFRARSDSGNLILQMLGTTCTGTACCTSDLPVCTP